MADELTPGCLVCGRPVEYDQFTSLCNQCDTAYLDSANEPVTILIIPPAFSWESQACQYAKYGSPGLTLEQHAVNAKAEEVAVGDPDTEMLIDCLLMRDVDGFLIGILNHYTGENEYEKTGNVNVWVRPDRQRRGVATRLLREAFDRWQVDWRTQRYTEDGLAMLKKLLPVTETNIKGVTP